MNAVAGDSKAKNGWRGGIYFRVRIGHEKGMKIGMATDHGGFALKEELAARLRLAGHEVVDFGAHELNPGDDYPDFVFPMARAVAGGEVERGIAI